jgi:NADPH:quinone reductase-like Zn-dependent oxidoreductase
MDTTMDTMKALRLRALDGVEGLVYEDVPCPRPQAGEVLARVHAAAITPSEFTWIGADRAFPLILGHEFSGVVAALGPGASGVAIGDAVYGLPAFSRDGAQAEYVIVTPDEIAPRPRSLDHAQAAVVPISALTAWQALFDHAHLAAGQRVLVHGAGGAVGAFAVQLAHWKGARVVGTASARNMQLVRELGADEVVDYATTGYEEAIAGVDVVLDTVGGETLTRSWRMLTPGGILISIVDEPPQEQAAAHSVRAAFFVVKPNRGQLGEITRLIDAGQLRPLVEAVYPLAQGHEAYTRAARGHLRGKIVLSSAA